MWDNFRPFFSWCWLVFAPWRFQWGAAKIPIMYDSHSWGEEGSTISNQFIRKFFQDAVLPKLGRNYEVMSIFIQQSDDFAKISPEFLMSICRGRTLCGLYFLWPIQGLQSYGSLVFFFDHPSWMRGLGKILGAKFSWFLIFFPNCQRCLNDQPET